MSPTGAPLDRDLVDFAEITEIELRVLRRMKEYTLGDHGSVFHGTGVDFVGLRDWQAGDRMSSIDWPQSTLTNFNPMVIREYEQPGTAPIVVVADQSPSTRCGISRDARSPPGLRERWPRSACRRCISRICSGSSRSTKGFARMSAMRPRVGRGHVIHCLDAYQGRVGMEDVRAGQRLATTIAGHLRRTTLLPVISDFLFEDAAERVKEIAELNSVHDVFLVMVDSAFAFEMPDVSAGWVSAFDVETGEQRLMSRRELRNLAGRVRAWQDDLERQAHDRGLDVLRIGVDQERSLPALLEFVMVRRVRKA